jgi:uncharacterized protein YbbK (DUF523 family)
MKLVSACLLGVKCTWDGTDKNRNERVVELWKRETLIPLCPEELGGLGTPRPPQEIQGGSGADVVDRKRRVKNREGRDVSEEFLRGAGETLRIARLFGADQFVGKSGSPSCGCGRIYNGSFSGTQVDGDGVTAALLKRNGITVITEEDL